MQQCDSSVSWDLETTSAVLFNSCTGYPYSHVCCTNSAYWCTKSTATKLQNTSVTLSALSTVAATATRPGLRSGKTMNYCLPYSGPAAWNRLPHEVRASPSLTVFKRKVLLWSASVLCALMLPSVLWRCWLGGRKGIRPVKNWVLGYGMFISTERGANDLHMVQLMPLSPHHLLLQ